MGSAIKSVGQAVFGQGAGQGQVIDTSTPEQRAAQSKAMGQYSSMLDNTDAGVQEQIAAQEAQARTGLEDQARASQQAIAQRGLGGTSIGLGAMMGSQQALGNKLEAIRAQAPMLKQQNLNFASTGINNIMGAQNQAKMYQQGQPANAGLMGAMAPGIGAGIGYTLGKG